MNLTPAFIEKHVEIAGADGQRWLDDLPNLVRHCTALWQIRLGAPLCSTYGFVAAATRANGQPAILKIIPPYLDEDDQADWLRRMNGRGAVRLFEDAPDNRALLMERCVPGTELASLVPTDDDHATRVAATFIRDMRIQLIDAHRYTSLAERVEFLVRIPSLFDGTWGPMDAKICSAAQRLAAEMLSTKHEEVLLHGDLHHHNILASDRGWLMVDPKGLVGDRAYEPSSFFYNPLGDWARELDGHKVIRRRIEVMADYGQLELRRVAAWAVVQGVLAAAWRYEEDDSSGPWFSEQVASWALALFEGR